MVNDTHTRRRRRSLFAVFFTAYCFYQCLVNKDVQNDSSCSVESRPCNGRLYITANIDKVKFLTLILLEVSLSIKTSSSTKKHFANVL